MSRHRRVEVGGHKADSLIEFDALLGVGNERGVLVAAEHDLPLRPSRIAVVHAERFEPRICDDVAIALRKDRALEKDRLPEGQIETLILRVPEEKRACLDFAGPCVGVVGAGAAGRDDVTADLRRSSSSAMAFSTRWMRLERSSTIIRCPRSP